MSISSTPWQRTDATIDERERVKVRGEDFPSLAHAHTVYT